MIYRAAHSLRCCFGGSCRRPAYSAGPARLNVTWLLVGLGSGRTIGGWKGGRACVWFCLFVLWARDLHSPKMPSTYYRLFSDSVRVKDISD